MTQKPHSEGFSTQQMLGLCAFILIVVLLKYLPIAFLGALFGLTLLRPNTTRFEQLQTIFFSLVGLALVLYLLLGAPYNPDLFPGLLGFFDRFFETCKVLARFWDNYLGRIKLYRIETLSLLHITNYVWLCLPVAAFISILGLFPKILSRISPKFLDAPPSAHHPFERFVGFLLHLLTVRPFWFGTRLVAKANVRALSLCLGLLASFTYLATRAPYPDLKIAFSALAVIPTLSLILGHFLRNSPLFTSAGTPPDSAGFQLGTSSSRPFYLTETNLIHHVELVAPTGTGKTTILKALLIDRIQKGHNVIFMDFKGEFKLLAWMYRLLKTLKREQDLRLFSLADPLLSAPYNPIATGTHSEIHSQIINALTWSDEYYKAFSSRALLTLLKALCEHRDKTGEQFHLGHVRTLLQSPPALSELLEKIKAHTSETADLSDLLKTLSTDTNRNALQGLLSNLSLLIESSCGHLITKDTEKGALTLSDVFSKPSVMYLLMNSLKLRETATITAKLVLQDLMKQIGEQYSSANPTKRPVTLIIDEFAECAVPDFISVLDKARGAGVSIVIAHQSRADLRSISPEFQDRVEANAATTIVSGIKNPLDAEYYASILGTRTTEKETVQKRKALFFDEEETGLKTVRDVEEFIVHPNRIKELNRGEVLAICRTADPKWGIVKVSLPNEFLEISDDGLNDLLRGLRQNYRSEGEAISLSSNKEEPPSQSVAADFKTTPEELPKSLLDWHSYSVEDSRAS